MSEKVIKAALLGLGTVGNGVYKVLKNQREEMEKKIGAVVQDVYKRQVEGKGEIVFTPPYMSYANHYILTTISQLQPDGETVFAYDIKMGEDVYKRQWDCYQNSTPRLPWKS